VNFIYFNIDDLTDCDLIVHRLLNSFSTSVK